MLKILLNKKREQIQQIKLMVEKNLIVLNACDRINIQDIKI